MSVETQIREKLIVATEPKRLDIVNESDMHAGHRGSPGTGNSHFRIYVVSDLFTGKSRLERHRIVNEALKDLMGNPIHALALQTVTPAEASTMRAS